MKQLLLMAGACLLASCVKLEVKPEGLVSDTVNAGKSIYKSVKAHQSGLTERSFSHSMYVEDQQTIESAMQACSQLLNKQIQQASAQKVEILSEESKISEDQKTVTCSAKAMI